MGMERWHKKDWNEIQEGEHVRVVRRYFRSPGPDTFVTMEGIVTDVDAEMVIPRGVFAVPPPGECREVKEIEFSGGQLCESLPFDGGASGSWSITSVEYALPPLPTTPGSVVLTDDREPAVLRSIIAAGDDEVGTQVWEWASGRPGFPTSAQLRSASIIYDAR